MLHCRDDLTETLRAVQRIACIRRRLRRSLFRLCGRHADWKRPPDALQLPARCPAPARSLLRTRSGLVCRFDTTRLQLGASKHCTVAIQRTLQRCGDLFCSHTSLYNINRPYLTVWRGQAGRRARGGRRSRASALHSHSRSNASRSPPSCSPSTSSSLSTG